MLVRLTARRPTFWSLLANLLMATGLGAVLYSVWFLLDGAVYQSSQRAEFLRAVAVEAPAVIGPFEPVSAAIPRRASRRDVRVFAQLKIPSVDLDVMVREGLDEQTLRRAAGHLASSAKPGERGNVVLLGHRDTFFRPLRELQRGDIAELLTTAGIFRYRIDTIEVVEPSDVDVDLNADASEITLVTCFPFQQVGPAPLRFVARGRLIEGRAPAPILR